MAIGTLGALALGSVASAGISGIFGAKSAKTQANAAQAGVDAQMAMQGRALEAQKEAAGNSIAAQKEFAKAAVKTQWDTAGKINSLASGAATTGNAFLKGMYDKGMALLEPQASVGRNALNALSYEAGIGQKPQGYAGFEASPGYQFNLDQGNQAIERMAAARGLRMSGGTMKAGARFASGLASNEYGNFYDRIAGLASGGAAATGAQVALGTNYGNARNANEWQRAGMQGQGFQNTGNAVSNIYSNLGAGIGNAFANIGNAGQAAFTNMGNAAAQGAINIGNAKASGYAGVNDALQGGINNVFSGLGYAQSGMFGANPGFGINPSPAGLKAYGFA
jgi:hypothetical protein